MVDVTGFPLDGVIAAIITIISLIYAWWQKTQIVELKTISVPAMVAVTTDNVVLNDFVLPRDGRILYKGADGWYSRINPSDQAKTIPDDKAYQAVSPAGKFYSGNKETIYYLLTSPDASGWRERNK